MGRTVLLYLLPSALIVSGWLRLEHGPGGDGALYVAALALLPALVRPVWGRAVAAVGVSILAVDRALDVSAVHAWPFDDRHFFGPLATRASAGFLAFYDVSLPFARADRPLMHGLVLLAIFGFCLAVALALAARRPLAAALALAVGAAWPVTLVTSAGLARGALVLAAVLSLLAAGGRRAPLALRPALVAGAALVAAAVAAGAAPAVAKGEFLEWKRWDFYDRAAAPVSVRFAWNASYDGIRYPKKRTTVLTVEGPQRPLYWRATTLDVFVGDRWVEEVPTRAIVDGPHALTTDPLLPDRASDERAWVKADVTVRGLRDRRLPGPSMPVAYDPGDFGSLHIGPGNVASLVRELTNGDRYTVWSYSPQPRPAQLAAARLAPARDLLERSAYLDLVAGAARAPLFGTPGRERALAELVEGYGVALERYRPLFRAAERVAGAAPHPYAAVVALEAWFRTTGGFRYVEQPRLARGLPPLVSFVTRFREGYCQTFAGAMALMLRYLGIPARIAAGFTSGTYDAAKRRWTVTDHEAHTWVEAWFDGWGWLPFDPTPGRGQLGGTYTAASPAFDVAAARGSAGALASGLSLPLRREQLEGSTWRGAGVTGDAGGLGAAGGDAGASLLRLLALVAAVLASVIAATKLVIRRARLFAREPRRVAAACRRDVADFLADQGVGVPAAATLGELARTVESALGVDARRFEHATAAARFAPPDEARGAAARARAELRALRRAMRQRLSLVARTRGLVSVRSLGLGA